MVERTVAFQAVWMCLDFILSARRSYYSIPGKGVIWLVLEPEGDFCDCCVQNHLWARQGWKSWEHSGWETTRSLCWWRGVAAAESIDRELAGPLMNSVWAWWIVADFAALLEGLRPLHRLTDWDGAVYLRWVLETRGNVNACDIPRALLHWVPVHSCRGEWYIGCAQRISWYFKGGCKSRISCVILISKCWFRNLKHSAF